MSWYRGLDIGVHAQKSIMMFQWMTFLVTALVVAEGFIDRENMTATSFLIRLPASSSTGKRILPNGCMAEYLKRTKKFPYSFYEVLGEDLQSQEDILDILSMGNDLELSYKDAYMAAYLLMESTEYTYLETLYHLEGDTLVRNNRRLKFDMYSNIQKSNLMPKFMLAYYLLGSTSIPYSQTHTSRHLREIIDNVYGRCSDLAPKIFNAIGDRLLTSAAQRNKASLARDFKWSSTSNFELNRISFNTLPVTMHFNNDIHFNRNLAGLISAEVSDTLFVAILNYIRAICGTQRLSWSTLVSWKIIKDCQLLKDSKTPFWNNVQFFGSLFNSTIAVI